MRYRTKLSRPAQAALAVLALTVLAGCSTGRAPSGRNPFEPNDPLVQSTPQTATSPSTPASNVTQVEVTRAPAVQQTTATVAEVVVTDPPTLPTFPTTSTRPTTTEVPFVMVTEGATVIVANASNIDGSAQRFSSQLARKGFTMAKATSSALFEQGVKKSHLYILPGAEAVARSISHVMGGIEIEYMPIPVPIEGGQGKLGEATIVLMLGTDWAGKRIP